MDHPQSVQAWHHDCSLSNPHPSVAMFCLHTVTPAQHVLGSYNNSDKVHQSHLYVSHCHTDPKSGHQAEISVGKCMINKRKLLYMQPVLKAPCCCLHVHGTCFSCLSVTAGTILYLLFPCFPASSGFKTRWLSYVINMKATLSRCGEFLCLVLSVASVPLGWVNKVLAAVSEEMFLATAITLTAAQLPCVDIQSILSFLRKTDDKCNYIVIWHGMWHKLGKPLLLDTILVQRSHEVSQRSRHAELKLKLPTRKH